MRDIPTEGRLDSSLALLHEGYPFIATRCARLHSDVFQARLLLQNTVCLHGEAAARLFYDESLFQRAGAAPAALLGTLLGKGGVQGLDGEAHRVRKRLFVEVLDEAGVAALVSQAEARWREALRHWCRRDSLVLLDEVHRLLTLAVCDWAGVRLAPDEVGLRCAQLVAMIEGGGSVGWRHLEARQARRDAEDWAMGWVRTARRGTAGVAGRPLAAVAAHRDLDGHLLDERTAAVELLNLLRPTVAVARFIVFAALELHRHPAWRERLREAPGACEAFAQEVRRLYAFFPFMAARVRRDFTWRGCRFRRGTRVLLDIYGSNRDARRWPAPACFRPERFAEEGDDALALLTQGGGDARTQHRCPGEGLAVALTTLGVRLLTGEMTYEVPPQDLTVDRSSMPMRPQSGLVLRQVRLLGGAAAG